MHHVFERAVIEYRKRGLKSSVCDASRYYFDTAFAFLYRMLAAGAVAILLSSDRVVRAETISRSSWQYADSAAVLVSVAGGRCHPELSENTGEWTGSAQRAHVLDDVFLVGPYGLVLTGDGELVISGSCDSEKMLRWSLEKMFASEGAFKTVWLLLKGFTGIRANPRDSDHEYTVSMLNPHATNYFHWTTEHLPRLRCLTATNQVPKADVELLLPRAAPSFIDDSLDLLGYHNRSVWTSDIERIDSLVVPDHQLRSRHHEFRLSPSDLQWLRKQMDDAGGDTTDPTAGQRIYISREDANARRVSNEPELLSQLREYGFEKYVLSEMTVLEQVRLFQGAEIVIAPHGAGLANLVYADRTAVIELYGEDLVQGRYYLLLANELGHEYYTLECETYGTDLVVPVAELTGVLDEVRETNAGAV